MPCLILTVPLFDITLSTILRLKHGVVKEKGVIQTVKLCILFCGRDHITHRLVALGMTKRQTVVFLCFMGALGGGFALLVKTLDNYVQLALVMCIYFLGLFILALKLDKAPVYDKQVQGPRSKVESHNE